ncbi:hypothetical protein KPB05_36480 [Burkholderia gladioli]|uniref:hypothetical protein n=1 Tax=Burkholderia gladioli TaxID=28095 RepID=UPI00285C6AAF|nr:hypothetical protein [Burkholderia gladioli]MDR8092957.1 hypothetical protein [Burkholderia gladioli]
MKIENTELLQEVETLSARGAKFQRKGKWIAGLGILFGVVSAIAFVVAREAGPDTVLSSLDIPQQIIARFSDTTAAGAGSGAAQPPFQSVFASVGTITNLMSYGALVIGIGLAAFAVATGDISRAIFPLFASGVVFFGSMLVRPMLGEDDTTNTASSALTASPRDAFQNAVNEKDVSAVAKQLGDGSSAADVYVKAQLAVLDKSSARDKTYLQMASSLLSAPPKPLGFTPRGDAAYAIDYAAYGTARSPTAIAYYTKAQEKVNTALRTRNIAGAYALLSLLVGIGLFGFGRSLNQRVERIHALTGMQVKPSDDRGLLFSELTDAQQADALRLFPGVKPEHRFRYTLDEHGAIHHREKLSIEEGE